MDDARRIELLCTDEPEPVQAAIDDLVAEGTVEEWNALVDAFAVEHGYLTVRHWLPGPLTEEYGTGFDRRAWTVIRLLAAAPYRSGTATFLRDRIARIRLGGRPPVTDLSPLRALPALEALDLRDPIDLSGVAAAVGPRWRHLKSLGLHSPALTDLTPLHDLSRLRELDLRGCTALRDLTPLSGLPLRRIRLEDTAATFETIPEDLHLAVRPRPLVTRIPAPAAAPPGRAGRPFARLKKLVLTRDWDTLRQGLELFRALDDADVAEAFLSGCTVHPTPPANIRGPFARRWARPPTGWDLRTPLPGTVDQVRPNSLLKHGELLRRYREAAIRGLIAFAPEGTPTADRLRSELGTLLCAGFADRIDLGPIGLLPNLRHLILDDVRTLEHKDALAAAPRLERLTLHRVTDDLAGLTAPGLGALTLAGPVHGALPALDGLPGVHTLWCEWTAGIPSVSALTSLRSLRTATVIGDAFDVGALGALEHLEELRLKNVTLTGYDLERLASAPALTRLELHPSTRLGGLRLPARLARIRVHPPA